MPTIAQDQGCVEVGLVIRFHLFVGGVHSVSTNPRRSRRAVGAAGDWRWIKRRGSWMEWKAQSRRVTLTSCTDEMSANTRTTWATRCGVQWVKMTTTRTNKKPTCTLTCKVSCFMCIVLVLVFTSSKNCGSGASNKVNKRLSCILEASESTRLRMGESKTNHHEDHSGNVVLILTWERAGGRVSQHAPDLHLQHANGECATGMQTGGSFFNPRDWEGVEHLCRRAVVEFEIELSYDVSFLEDWVVDVRENPAAQPGWIYQAPDRWPCEAVYGCSLCSSISARGAHERHVVAARVCAGSLESNEPFEVSADGQRSRVDPHGTQFVDKTWLDR